MEISEKSQTNLEQIYKDIKKAAEIAGVAYDRHVVQNVVEAYKDFFRHSPVTFVTNTQPLKERKLSVRYADLQVPHDPFQTALEKGFLSAGSHPIYQLLTEIRSRFPMMGYGIDIEVSSGLTNIWPFITPQPIEKILQITNLPRSVKDYFPYFYRHNLEVFFLFSLDYLNKTVNIYFMVKDPGLLTIRHITDMLTGLDFRVPDIHLLEYSTHATTIFTTFSWNSEDITRLCFRIIAHEPRQVPTHLDPFLEIFTQQAPIISEQRKFIYSLVFERRNHYIKIENDYTGTMIDIMERSTVSPGTHKQPGEEGR